MLSKMRRQRPTDVRRTLPPSLFDILRVVFNVTYLAAFCEERDVVKWITSSSVYVETLGKYKAALSDAAISIPQPLIFGMYIQDRPILA